MNAGQTTHAATRTAVAVTRAEVVPLRRCTPLVSFLISSGVHLLLLLVLTVLFVATPVADSLRLEFSIASTNSDDDFESFSMALPAFEASDTMTQASGSVVASVPVGLDSIEPDLVDVESLAGMPQQGDGDELTNAAKPASKSESRRQGSFFGAKAYGDEFVFVVDNSRSMLSPCGFRYGHTRFQVACQELLRSIKSLDKDQEFCVIFFGLKTRVMFDRPPQLIKVSPGNRQKLVKWIATLSPGHGTDPRFGMLQALKLKPSAIFLLSDGEFNGQNYNFHNLRGNPPVELIIKRHLHRSIPVHTIAFEDVFNRRRLRNIATLTAGTHKFIGSQSEQQLLVQDLTSSNLIDVDYALQSILEDPHELSDDRYIKPATVRLTKLLRAKQQPLRESAHHAMLALAESLEVDTSELLPVENLADVSTAKFAVDTWVDIWRGYFRNRVAETRLTRVVVP